MPDINLQCFFCHNKFYRRKIHKESKRYFCSPECTHKQQQTDQSDEYSPFRRILEQARAASKRKNILIDINVNFIKKIWDEQEGLCNLSGIPLHLGSSCSERKSGNKTASLDRIDSDGDYTEDNVQILHKIINDIKRDFKEDYYIWFCRRVAEHTKERVLDLSGLDEFISTYYKKRFSGRYPIDSSISACYNGCSQDDPPF